MTNLDDKAIRRRADGSIDTTHYMQQGREQRSSMLRHLIEFLISPKNMQMPVSRRAAPDGTDSLKGVGVA